MSAFIGLGTYVVTWAEPVPFYSEPFATYLIGMLSPPHAHQARVHVHGRMCKMCRWLALGTSRNPQAATGAQRNVLIEGAVTQERLVDEM